MTAPYDPTLMQRLTDARDIAARRLANGLTSKFLADHELDIEGVRLYARHLEHSVEELPPSPAAAFLIGFLMALELEDVRVNKLLATLAEVEREGH